MIKSLNKKTITVLGSGTSTGIPQIGCTCVVCTSLDHRDQRLRSSIFIETKAGKKILVDTTPDLRNQVLSNKISTLDFVIITHDHADHLHGIDDLRPFCFGPPKREIPIYTNEETKKSITERFPYIFKPKDLPSIGGGIPILSLNAVEIEKIIIIQDEEFFFFNYPHGYGITMGFIHDDFAYIVDCFEIPDHIVEILKEKKLKMIILDCLQRMPHQTHLTVEKSFNFIKRIAPEKAGLIHMNHDLSHSILLDLAEKEFGNSVFPLFDGQKLSY